MHLGGYQRVCLVFGGPPSTSYSIILVVPNWFSSNSAQCWLQNGQCLLYGVRLAKRALLSQEFYGSRLNNLYLPLHSGPPKLSVLPGPDDDSGLIWPSAL